MGYVNVCMQSYHFLSKIFLNTHSHTPKHGKVKTKQKQKKKICLLQITLDMDAVCMMAATEATKTHFQFFFLSTLDSVLYRIHLIHPFPSFYSIIYIFFILFSFNAGSVAFIHAKNV